MGFFGIFRREKGTPAEEIAAPADEACEGPDKENVQAQQQQQGQSRQQPIMRDEAGEHLVVFTLAVSHGRCAGVFWRGNPITGKPPPSRANWPHNGALLRGRLHQVKKKEWLEVTGMVPPKGNTWIPVPPGTWMEADGGRLNGGRFLHPPNREVPK